MFPLSKLLFTGGYIVLSLSFFSLLFLPLLLLLLFLLAIGENYIKKIFLFFNILFIDVFSYRLTARNPRDVVTEKGDKKSPLLFLSIIFLSLFSREKTKLLFVNHYTFYIKIKIYKRGDFPFLYIF